MFISLLREPDVEVELETLAARLNDRLSTFVLKVHEPLEIPGTAIRHPESYRAIRSAISRQTRGASLVLLFTRKPYDNNYFFEAQGTTVIVSFYAWEKLTNLPLSNGVVYFLCDIILGLVDGTLQHDESTGCMFDFLWNKGDVDLGMRNSFVCRRCLARLAQRRFTTQEDALMMGARRMLDELGLASKWNRDVIDYMEDSNSRPVEISERSEAVAAAVDVTNDEAEANARALEQKSTAGAYDVFLCHNSSDKQEVKAVGERLRTRGILPWLDEWALPPGRPWQP